MLVNFYSFFLVAHIVIIIAWMVGLLYLPRLYVYHCTVSFEDKAYSLFLTMEKKLLRVIMLPAMLLTWLFGILLMFAGEFHKDGWLHTKILFVIILSGFHGMLIKHYKNFLNGRNKKSPQFFRIINEVPTVILIIIVSLVIFKPF